MGLTVLGIAPLVTVYGLWKALSWARPAAFAVGALLFVWLGVEVAVVGYQAEPPLQIVYAVVGLVILIAAAFTRPTS